MSAMSSGFDRTDAKRIRGRSHFWRSSIRRNATMWGFEIASIFVFPFYCGASCLKGHAVDETEHGHLGSASGRRCRLCYRVAAPGGQNSGPHGCGLGRGPPLRKKIVALLSKNEDGVQPEKLPQSRAAVHHRARGGIRSKRSPESHPSKVRLARRAEPRREHMNLKTEPVG